MCITCTLHQSTTHNGCVPSSGLTLSLPASFCAADAVSSKKSLTEGFSHPQMFFLFSFGSPECAREARSPAGHPMMSYRQIRNTSSRTLYDVIRVVKGLSYRSCQSSATQSQHHFLHKTVTVLLQVVAKDCHCTSTNCCPNLLLYFRKLLPRIVTAPLQIVAQNCHCTSANCCPNLSLYLCKLFPKFVTVPLQIVAQICHCTSANCCPNLSLYLCKLLPNIVVLL